MDPPKKYIIKSFNKTFYCKISNYNENYTISVGGKKDYCFIVSIKKDSPNEAYIDRVDYNEACVKDGSLEENGGMYKLISSGLYFIKENFPNVQKITLMDDSHVLCSKEYKLNLAFDYLIKYNETWYQHKFQARLLTPFDTLFEESLAALDGPLPDFHFIASLIPYIEEFQNIYIECTTPREFIQTIRKIYNTQYCFKVCKWLHHFLNTLNIKLFKEFWYIPVKTIQIPEKYSVSETNDEIRGGKKYTMKNRNFRIVTGGDVSILGIYE